MAHRSAIGFTLGGRRSLGLLLLVLVVLALLYPIPSHSRTWYIKADGTGDAPTIQAGVDSSTSGDSLLLADGTYAGVGNRGIHVGNHIFVGSQTGDPSQCIMDCENQSGGMYISSHVTIQGLTIVNGSTLSGGGAITCELAGLTMRNCLIINNSSPEGGGIFSFTCQYLEITNCVFDGNSASTWGGAIFSKDLQSVVVSRCIFTNNSAQTAGAILAAVPSAVSVDCSDIVGNQGGDWVGGIQQHAGVNGNLSIDPEYCGINDSGNYFLQSDSPCAPGNHPDGNDCGLIGAMPVNCGEVAAKKSTWGSMKARFRK